ncbi:hypothetical protein, partial [Streptomyces bauhiniae]
MTDEQLAQAVRGHTFTKNADGVPILPPQSLRPLGGRLKNALVDGNGVVITGLGPAAQAALGEQGFTLATSSDGRKTGLHPDTLRSGGTHQQMSDEDLAQAVRDHTFTKDADDVPILPLRNLRPLGRRLHHALVDRNGVVNTGLGPAAQAALREQGFTLATSSDGRKTGLHPKTPLTGRPGGTHQQVSDEDLAQAVRVYNFTRNADGVPILPPQSLRLLGRRLQNAVVGGNGAVSAGLGPAAQAALREQGFILATSSDGRKTGLHPDTLFSGGRNQPRQAERRLVAAAAAGPMPGGSRQPTGQTIF